MTDTATDQPSARVPIPLEAFEGHDVIGSRIKITKAGDGLSEALNVEPQAFHHGEVVHVVLECVVSKVQHSPVKDTDALTREHTFEAQAAVIVDQTLVGPLIARQKELIRDAKEKAAGIMTLPYDDAAELEQGSPVVEALEQLRKAQLQSLCEANGISFPKSANSARLIELLKDVPGMLEAAQSYKTVPDITEDDDATVTSISDRRPATD